MPMLRLLTAFTLLLCAAPALAAPSAPAFSVKLLEGGKTFDSRSRIGKKVLVVRFQASWCKVCVEEAPVIERVWQKYRPAGVEVVGLQVEDTQADARRFLRGATYPAGLDAQLLVANRFKAKGTPYTVVIDKRGEIVARIAGRSGEARLARVLDALVKEPITRKPPARLQ
jgi:thiol-disulfide isomerase/thioredoxin